MKKQVIGVVGCGVISDIYLKNLTGIFKNLVRVKSCTDLDRARRVEKAEIYGVEAVGSLEDMLADPEIDIILNLTTPPIHAEVDLAAVRAGKHVFSEKPLAVSLEESAAVLDEARRKGVRVGCAPDTFLGAGIQKARNLIDDGIIGDVVSVSACMACHGHESWHPHPEFYYQTGGGPMMDMGPYYLTALVNLAGPITRVAGMVNKAFGTRTMTSPERNGDTVDVGIMTHVTGSIEFAGGAVGTIVTSFDIWKSDVPRIEVHGTKGSLSIPDPNTFGNGTNELTLFREGSEEWESVPLTEFPYGDNSRGLGVVDMALAIGQERLHRASGDLAGNVLEAMLGFEISAQSGSFFALSGGLKDRPEAMEKGLAAGAVWK
ncbi:MAG: Gfo/Idh/MocA family oxidoreductase [Bacteroidetes bacterium]|nr:Gfo/Idh/MocA family oxidoreductase [Bacteroidota bacterium]